METVDEPDHGRAVGEALFVTFLWSTSYVLIAVGLRELPALTFAGLRYALAFFVLVPFFVRAGGHRTLRELSAREWLSLVALGVVLYALTQGAQFAALVTLRPATVSLVLSFTPAVVALLAGATLGERPTRGGWVGIALLSVGALLYLSPGLAPAEIVGLAIAVLALLANATGAVLGRHANLGGRSPLFVTTVSMGIGSVLLLATGVGLQGLPAPSPGTWLLVAWLSVVNTAVAFTLWNRCLTVLSAVESSVVNNTMLVQVALLGWLALGQALSPVELLGLLGVGIGALVVQLSGRRDR
jgi:drug/metabolite transporter (DMT)-like permease